ncbi:MAG TPA: thioredoxin fold domain-containing protein [Pseudomonadales bacterium]|nr:thioredoxin fold domain-containing protein [Pseudomonadales bacterium]
MKRLAIVWACLLIWAPAVFALSPHEVAIALKKSRPDLPIVNIKKSRLPGFYEVSIGEGRTLYVTDDAKHFIMGDLFSVDDKGFTNLSEEDRAVDRKKLMATVADKDTIIFSPPKDKVKATISVFTDVDCPYCRKFHQEVPELNSMGIAVRYLAYPRAGVGSAAYKKMVSAWCSDDPHKALTMEKAGHDVAPRTCPNPVAAEYKLGNEVGVTGTPTLVYEDGTLVPGYLPAKVLAKSLGVLN